MKLLKYSLALVFLSLAAPVAASTQCEKQETGYKCQNGDKTYTVNNVSSEAEAIAAVNNFLSSSSGYDADINNSNETLALSAPAGGNCDTGFNLGLSGQGGAGICWNSNAGAQGLAVLAEQARLAGSNCVALKIVTSHRKTKHIKVNC